MEKIRRYDLDWLRVMAFYLLIFYHTALIFVSWNFHIKNGETSKALEPLLLFLNQWRLPLIFFISGAVIRFSLGYRKSYQFIIERHNRLLIPLVFGMFVIIPPQIYFEHLQHGIIYKSYSEFYSKVLEMIPYPEGNFSWHHLWYIIYLFVYCLLCLPIFLIIRNPKTKGVLLKIGEFLNKPHKLFLPVIILAVIYFLLRDKWGNDRNLVSDWFNFSYYLAIFLFGYITCSIEPIWDTIEKSRHTTLIISIISFFGLLLLWWRPVVTVNWNQLLLKPLQAIIVSVNIWGWILTILGFGKKYLNKPSKILKYANESVYPFYILHQTILVIFGFYFAQIDIPIFVKLITLYLIVFIVSYLLYELIIKHTILTRILFGMKPRKNNKP